MDIKVLGKGQGKITAIIKRAVELLNENKDREILLFSISSEQGQFVKEQIKKEYIKDKFFLFRKKYENIVNQKIRAIDSGRLENENWCFRTFTGLRHSPILCDDVEDIHWLCRYLEKQRMLENIDTATMGWEYFLKDDIENKNKSVKPKYSTNQLSLDEIKRWARSSKD